MNTLRIFFGIFLFSLIFIDYTVGQEKDPGIEVTGFYDASSNAYLIKWFPNDLNLFNIGLENGYTLKRTAKYDANGNEIDHYNQIKNIQILSTSIKPYSSSELAVLAQSNSKAAFIDSLIYNENLNQTKANPSLKDILDNIHGNESKHLFSFLVAEQSFDLSIALGLGYIDNTSDPNNEYTYYLSINMSGNEYVDGSSTTYIPSVETNQLPAIEGLTGYGADSVIVLSWDISELKTHYTYYDIERSLDGQSFQKVNTNPYMFLSSEETDLISYSDDVPENNVTYYYRVRGISSFGFDPPYSEVINLKAIPKVYNIRVNIDSIHATSEELLSIHWESIDESTFSKMSHFNLYRSKSISEEPEKINSSNIPLDQKNYDVINPGTDNYYYLEIIDDLGREYRSIAVLGEGLDITPPTAPLGLYGNITSDGLVELNWNDNTEEDLDGYQVLYSNERNGTYAQITSTAIKVSEFAGSVNTSIEVDSIFYRVFAVDTRYNSSDVSEVLALGRPDHFSPSNPVISNIIGTVDGIRIAWRLSTSDDVVKHILQRKISDGSSWDNVIVITDDSQYGPLPLIPHEVAPSNYIDASELQLRMFDYRLVAEDEVGNQSSSRIMPILPFDDGIRGEIIEEQYYDFFTSDGEVSSQNGGLSVAPYIILNWGYNTDFPNTLLEFKIYKTESDDLLSESEIEDLARPFTTIATISPRQDPIVLDEATNTTIEGYYLKDSLKFAKSQYQYYKIIAWHRDGGFSEWSEILIVNIN